MDDMTYHDVEGYTRQIDDLIDDLRELYAEDMGEVAHDFELSRLFEVLATASSNVLQYTRNAIQSLES